MADPNYEDLKNLPIQDQVMLLKETLQAYLTDPATTLSDLNRFGVEIRMTWFFEFTVKQGLGINGEAVRRYVAESYRATESKTDTVHLLTCLKLFFRYSAKQGLWPDITAGVYPDFGGDQQFRKRVIDEQDEE